MCEELKGVPVGEWDGWSGCLLFLLLPPGVLILLQGCEGGRAGGDMEELQLGSFRANAEPSHS